MRRLEIPDGARFGRLTVLGDAKTASCHRQMLCRCDCGNETVVLLSNLRMGNTTSCGCARREQIVERNKAGLGVARGSHTGDSEGRNCSKCGQYKPWAEFSKRGSGRHSWCRGCRSAHEVHISLDPERARRNHLMRRYGITLEQYNEKLVSQGGVCALCGRVPQEISLHVDHDHSCCPESRTSCGKCIRDLLCYPCNGFIGKIESEYGERALAYIRRWREVVSSQ